MAAFQPSLTVGTLVDRSSIIVGPTSGRNLDLLIGYLCWTEKRLPSTRKLPKSEIAEQIYRKFEIERHRPGRGNLKLGSSEK